MNALRTATKYLFKLIAVAFLISVGPVGLLQAKAQNQFTGVNLSGLNFTPGQQAPVTYAIPYYKGKGMNVFRVGISWELIQPALNGPLNTTVVSQLIALRDQAATANTSVIFEIHNYGRRTVAGVPVIIGETPVVTSANFNDLWAKLSDATTAGLNGKYVIFGLMNEPHDQNTATYVSVVNAAIAAIRNNAHDNLILVNGNNWGSYGWLPGSDNYTAMLGVSDPIWKYAFDIHQYFDPWGAGQTSAVVPYATWSQGLTGFMAWARQYGRKGFVGEFAADTSTAGSQAVSQFLGLMSQNKDVMLGWTWWGGGGWWAHDFMFLIDPYGSKWDATNPDRDLAYGQPATGKATTWAAPMTDKPQMSLLTPYLQAH